jgi:hypothetical protein
MSKRIDLVDLDYQYKIWKNLLLHFSRELEIVYGRLGELKSQMRSIRISDEALEDHKENIRRCNNKIVLQEEEMSVYIDDFPIGVKHEIYLFHQSIDNQMQDIKRTQQAFLDKLDKN